MARFIVEIRIEQLRDDDSAWGESLYSSNQTVAADDNSTAEALALRRALVAEHAAALSFVHHRLHQPSASPREAEA